MIRINYTCECPLEPGETRALYLVRGHDGSAVACSYCEDCAALAAMDWNGETASITPLLDQEPPQRPQPTQAR